MSSVEAQPDRDRTGVLLDLLALVTICFIVGGAPAPHVNETHYLTKARHYWAPGYASRDFFLTAADAHLVFYWTIGWLTKFVSLEAVAWIGRVASWLLIAAGWRALWESLHPTAGKALLGSCLSLALFLLLIDRCNFAGEWVVGGVEGKSFAYGFVFFGLAALVRGAWDMPWIWFGAAAAFHPLVGGWAVVAALVVWVFERCKGRATTPLSRMVRGLALGGLLSLPGLLPALALSRGVEADAAAEAARVYTFDRLAHHLAPLSLPCEQIRKRTLRFVGLSAVMCGLAVAWRRGGRLSGLPDPASPAMRRLFAFAVVSLAFNLAAACIEFAFDDQPLVAAKLLRYYWYRQADVAVPMVVGLAVAWLVTQALNGASGFQKLVATIPMLWAGWLMLDLSVDRWKDATPPALTKMEAPADWIAACTWMRENTPADALALVPRHGQSFKWYAGRADAGNWKDVPQDAAGILEWRRRMTDLFTLETVSGERATVGEPARLGTRRVRELAAKYDAQFVVTLAEPPLALKQVFPVSGEESNAYAAYDTAVPIPRPAAATTSK